MIMKSMKNWISERYTKIEAEKEYEREKEEGIALLLQEKFELEKSLSPYDFEKLTIDYKGIEKIMFEGDMVYASTKGEQYIIRLKSDEDCFKFLKNLNIKDTTNSLISRDKWIITTPIYPNVNRDNLPKLEFLYINDDKVNLHLDLTKEIELLPIRGIVDAIHGEFSVYMNLERINEALMQLMKHLNERFKYNFTIKVDASDVRAFSFYIESDEGDAWALKELGIFDVEQLLLHRQQFITNLEESMKLKLTQAEIRLQEVREERLRKEAIERERRLRQEAIERERKIAMEREAFRLNTEKLLREQMGEVLLDVKVILDHEDFPSFTCNKLTDVMTIQANAEKHYFDAIINLNSIRRKLQYEQSRVRKVIENFRIEFNSSLSYSAQEGYIHPFLNENDYIELVKEVNENCFTISVAKLKRTIECEHPLIQEVLNRFTIVEELDEPISLEKEELSAFINDSEYESFVLSIRNSLRHLMEFELSERHGYLPQKYQHLLGVNVYQDEIVVGKKKVVVVTIQKPNQETYKKYFYQGQLMPSHLIPNFSDKTK